jgi:cytochrome c oxidase assembly factor CtaG
MAVNVILRAVVSIFAIGIAMVAFMPAVYDLYYNQSLWDEAPAEAIQVRDNLYATFLALPLFMIGAVFLWSYISTSRKDYGY